MTIENIRTRHGDVRYNIIEGTIEEVISKEDRTQFTLREMSVQFNYFGGNLKIAEGDEVRAAIPLYSARKSLIPFSNRVVINPRVSEKLFEREAVSAMYVEHTDPESKEMTGYFFQAEYAPVREIEKAIPSFDLNHLVYNDKILAKK